MKIPDYRREGRLSLPIPNTHLLLNWPLRAHLSFVPSRIGSVSRSPRRTRKRQEAISGSPRTKARFVFMLTSWPPVKSGVKGDHWGGVKGDQ
jgi:hypothetical protein